jgi:hypothetical protein
MSAVIDERDRFLSQCGVLAQKRAKEFVGAPNKNLCPHLGSSDRRKMGSLPLAGRLLFLIQPLAPAHSWYGTCKVGVHERQHDC